MRNIGLLVFAAMAGIHPEDREEQHLDGPPPEPEPEPLPLPRPAQPVLTEEEQAEQVRLKAARKERSRAFWAEQDRLTTEARTRKAAEEEAAAKAKAAAEEARKAEAIARAVADREANALRETERKERKRARNASAGL